LGQRGGKKKGGTQTLTNTEGATRRDSILYAPEKKGKMLVPLEERKKKEKREKLGIAGFQNKKGAGVCIGMVFGQIKLGFQLPQKGKKGKGRRPLIFLRRAPGQQGGGRGGNWACRAFPTIKKRPGGEEIRKPHWGKERGKAPPPDDCKGEGSRGATLHHNAKIGGKRGEPLLRILSNA